MCACMHGACMRAYVHAGMRACMRACEHMHACMHTPARKGTRHGDQVGLALGENGFRHVGRVDAVRRDKRDTHLAYR